MPNAQDQLPGRPYDLRPPESRTAGPVNCIRWLAPKTSTGDGTVRCPALFLTANLCLRVLGGPGEPLDLDAVHPGEPRAAFERSAGDVPVHTEPLIDERLRLLLPISTEDPPRVTPHPGRAQGLPLRRRGLARAVPEHEAPLPAARLGHSATVLEPGA